MITDNFTIDSRLTAESITITDWSLSRLLLKNDISFPWFILVPKRDNIQEIYQLGEQDSLDLLNEIKQLSKIVKTFFTADKINVAALGNVVPQLHVHVIARYKQDAKWPNPPWGNPPGQPYSPEELNNILTKLGRYL
ncbi:MAG: hypothetical protein A3E87_06805 [Gammaproteobacteria bacterium RIFCSPHIGHO2_12_FULL_35_23]|nr:MAG: hypothetical protein A3E87_06805 [Gammaproteobacteria bacterium RIFCSPHIGHO2_12_FULL_35_23]